MREEAADSIDPYRLLFPIGAIVGVIGVSLWFLLAWRLTSFYPRTAHANIMFFGFLWCFVAGFLMTAIPRMTSTYYASHSEILVAIVCGLLQVILNIRNSEQLSVGLFALQNAFLVGFIVRRFLVHRRVPFFGMIFIPAAFVQAFLGVALFFLAEGVKRDFITLLCGEAFFINLIVGVGSRLIPAISRLPGATLPTEKTVSSPWVVTAVTLASLNIGYWLEIGGYRNIGTMLRVLALGLAAVSMLKVISKPTKWSAIGIGLKVGVVFLFIGQVMSVPLFESGIAGAHMTYIGGISLITLLVSMRVMLAHGGQNLNYEINSRRIILLTTLFAISAILRLAGGVQVSGHFVLLSAILFFAIMMIWGHKFWSILRVNRDHKT